jgi:hypothetical protein
MVTVTPEAVRGDDDKSGAAGEGTGPLSAVVDSLASFVGTFAPGCYSGEDAATLVGLFTRAERLCAAGKTLAAQRAAESHRHLVSGHRTPAEWLAAQTGESVGQAIDVLTLGGDLVDQPGVEEALRQGTLSPSRARLVSKAVKVNPTREGDLITGARNDSFKQLKERCLRAKAEGRSTEQADRLAARIHQDRRCRTWTDDDGAFRLDATLAPEAGARVLASLTAQSDRIFARARTEGTREPTDAYRADALVALVTGEGILTPTTTERRASGKRAATGPDVDCGRTPDPRATTILRVDLDALRRGSVGEGEICEIPGVGPVPVEVARQHLGEDLVDVVITNGVDVTTICRLGRAIPVPLQIAIAERDQYRCVVPGCGVTNGLERDHWRVDFAKGGVASMDNLALLCAHHHKKKTHHDFTLVGGPDRWQLLPPEQPKVTTRNKKRTTKRTPRKRPPPTRPPATPPPDGSPLFHLEE